MGREWSVLLEFASTTAGRPAETVGDAVEGALDKLKDLHAAASYGPSSFSFRMTVAADSPIAAAVAGIGRLAGVASTVGLPDWPLECVEAIPDEALEAELQKPASSEILVGVSEIALMLGVSKQRASMFTRRSDFPSPVAQLGAGPVWSGREVRNFVNHWARRPGRPASGASKAVRVKELKSGFLSSRKTAGKPMGQSTKKTKSR
ncbi:MAG TPA: hypothetical protein VNE62_03790 [Actinomycetota bacterium]|nr:hypothetical protein [Actinomycetota bacterium]